MNVSPLLQAARFHARLDPNSDEFDTDLLLMLSAAAGDVAHAANYELPEVAEDLPDDLKFAIIDQATMLFDARGSETKRPEGLSMAAASVVARYRGVAV